VSEERGSIAVSDEVIRSIIHICSQDVPGVACVSEDSLINGAIKMLRSTDFPKGIRIMNSEDGEKKKVDVSIQVEYGVAIPGVTGELQKEIKDQVERITGIPIEEINIHVDGVQTPTATERIVSQPAGSGAVQDIEEVEVETLPEPEK